MFIPLGPLDPDNLPEDMPEEIRNMIRGQLERARIEEERREVSMEVTQNEIFHLFEKLDPSDLALLGAMLKAVTRQGGALVIQNWVGQIEAVLRLKYPHVCRNCGTGDCKNSAPLAPPPSLAADSTAGESTPAQKVTVARALMDEYNVIQTSLGLVCGGCGIYIHSLEDRMRREPGPGGCSGCRQKSAHG